MHVHYLPPSPDLSTDRPTDGLTNRVTYRVACMRQKSTVANHKEFGSYYQINAKGGQIDPLPPKKTWGANPPPPWQLGLRYLLGPK